MLELEPLSIGRLVASAAALNQISWPETTIAMRIAADEVLATPDPGPLQLEDPYAIYAGDSGFVGGWLPADEATVFLSRHCEWRMPAERPAFAQGAVAGIPAKLWLEADRVLFVIPVPYRQDFEERTR